MANNQAGVKEYIISLGIMLAIVLVESFLWLQPLYIIAISACLICMAARFSPMQTVAAAVLLCAAEIMLYAAFRDRIGIFTVIPSVIIGVFLRKKRNMASILIGGLVGYILSAAAMVFIYNTFIGQIDVFAKVYAMLKTTADQAAEIMGSDAEQAQKTFSLIIKILPSIAICGIAAVSYFSFLASRAVLKRIDSEYNCFKPFTTMRSDKFSAIIFVVLFISNMFVNGDTVSVVLLNLFVLIGAMLWLCGLSVIWFYIKRARSAFGKTIAIIALVCATPFIMYTQVGLGCADALFNFRKLGKK